jgi:hypothetical protein
MARSADYLRTRMSATEAAVVHTECTVPRLRVHTDVRLNPEVPLLIFAGLVHLRVALR